MQQSARCWRGNYLRVRGEYAGLFYKAMLSKELPPRTRRIPLPPHLGAGAEGTTSAYAENTKFGGLVAGGLGNYLRVRGEYGVGEILEHLFTELPPRTRRIPIVLGGVLDNLGTTSAYAENTGVVGGIPATWWNYLRVRGEYLDPPPSPYHQRELPPRTRRIHMENIFEVEVDGTTSAYAENTLNELGLL